jgi:hypothetical protein
MSKAVYPEEIKNPVGVIGEVAEHIYNNSFVPNRMSAYCAALAFMNLIIGARYKTPDGLTGGLYLALIGPTGCGKDIAFSSVDDMVTELVYYGTDKNATLRDLETSTIAKASSREGIEDTLSGQTYRPDILIQLDELGKFAQEGILGKGEKARAIATMLTEMYGKRKFIRRKLSTAGQKKVGNESNVIKNFSVTAIGATNLESLTNGIRVEQIYDGFLNRFLFFNLESTMEPGRRNLQVNEISIKLLKKVFKIATRGIKESGIEVDGALAVITKQTIVSYTEEALDVFHAVDTRIRMHEKQTMDRAFKIRIAMHSKKLAICMAVAKNLKKPLINENIARRAVSVVEYCNNTMIELLRDNIVDDNMKRVLKQMYELLHSKTSAKTGMMVSCFYSIPSYALATKMRRQDLDDQFEGHYTHTFQLIKVKRPGKGRPGMLYVKEGKAEKVKRIYKMRQNRIMSIKVRVVTPLVENGTHTIV